MANLRTDWMVSDLEKAALEGHAKGLHWHAWWQQHGEAVKAVEPFNNKRLHKLVKRLAHILLTGERSGQFAAGDNDPKPWLKDDDTPAVDDTHTNARLQLDLPFISDEVRT